MDKYVYLIPHGGFNDCLSVIYLTLEYCITYNRILLIDMKHSFYKINLSDFFEFNNIECKIIYDYNEIKKILLKKKRSIYPSTISHDIEYILENGLTEKYSILPDSNIDEDIIISFRSGGSGVNGFKIFKQLIPNDYLLRECKKRLDIIGSNYLSIQVRDTDAIGKIPFDYINLFEKHKKEILKYDKIYVATDSNTVLNYFKSKHKNVYNFTTYEDNTGNSPLHYSSLPGKTKIYDLIADIYIIINSDKLLSNSKGNFINLIKHSFHHKKYNIDNLCNKNIFFK